MLIAHRESPTMTDDDALVELLIEWEERSERDATLTVETFLNDRPQYINPFRQLLRNLGRLDPMIKEQPNQPAPPSLAGRYRPYQFHAQGGLGQVFRAKDGEVGRDVAIKVIRPDALMNGRNRSRFVREAELTGRLEHPGIVPVYGLCNDGDGQPYYAMRFIEGTTFESIILDYHRPIESADSSTRNVELRRLLRHFVAVCETMAYAHEQAVIHRDLKPKNIMIGQFGETIVVDWGLAKNLHEKTIATEVPAIDLSDLPVDLQETPKLMPLETSRRPSNGDETRRGERLGTPAFMSPEQARGEVDELGPASDIYSLGASLYQLLTGQTPYSVEYVGRLLGKPTDKVSFVEFINTVAAGIFPVPRTLNPYLPRSLEAICLKAMSLTPADRYGSAKDLAADVERWLADEPVSAWREPFTVRTRRWLRKHRSLVTGSVATLIVGIVAAAALAIQQRDAYAKEKRAHEKEKQAHETEIRLNGRLNQSIEEVNLANINLNRVNSELVQSNRREAAAKNEAISEKEQAVRALYLARMHYVGNMIEQNNYAYAWSQLRDTRLLPGQRSDYRGVEWHLAWNLFERPALANVEVSITASRILISNSGDRLVLIGNRITTVVRVSDGKRLFSDSFNDAVNPKVSASGDLKRLAIINGKSIEVWSIPDQEPAKLHWEFKPFEKALDEIALSPDGQKIVAMGDSGKIVFGDVMTKSTRPPVTQFEEKAYFTSPLQSPSFTFDGTVLGFLHKGRPKVWHVEQQNELVFPGMPSSDFSALQMTSADTICLWHFSGKLSSGILEETGTQLVPKFDLRFRQWEFRDQSSSVAFQSNGSSRSYRGNTFMSEIPVTGEGPMTLVLSDHSLFGFRSSRYLPKTLFRNPFAPLQQVRIDDPVSFAIPFPKSIRSFSTSANGKFIAIVATNGDVSVGETAKVLGTFLEFRHPGPNPVQQLIFMPNGSLLSVAQDLSVVRGIPQGREEGRLLAPETKSPNLLAKRPRRSVAMSSDGKRLAFREENRIEIVYSDGGEIVSYLELNQKSLFGSEIPMAFVPGETKLVFASEAELPRGKITPESCFLVIWDYGNFEKDGYLLQMLGGSSLISSAPHFWHRLLTQHSKEVVVPSMLSTMEVSPDGNLLAAAGRDGIVRMFNLNRFGKFPSWNIKVSAGVSAVRFSNDGNWLAVGSYDGWVRVYSMPYGGLHMELPAHRGEARSLAFTPDSKSLVSGGSEGRVRFISLTYRQDVFSISTGAAVSSLAFGPKGDLLAVGGPNGDLRYYRTITDETILEAARRLWKGQPKEREPRRDYFLALWSAYLSRSKAGDTAGANAALREAIESGKLIENPDTELAGWLPEFAKANGASHLER